MNSFKEFVDVFNNIFLLHGIDLYNIQRGDSKGTTKNIYLPYAIYPNLNVWEWVDEPKNNSEYNNSELLLNYYNNISGIPKDLDKILSNRYFNMRNKVFVSIKLLVNHNNLSKFKDVISIILRDK